MACDITLQTTTSYPMSAPNLNSNQTKQARPSRRGKPMSTPNLHPFQTLAIAYQEGMNEQISAHNAWYKKAENEAELEFGNAVTETLGYAEHLINHGYRQPEVAAAIDDLLAKHENHTSTEVAHQYFLTQKKRFYNEQVLPMMGDFIFVSLQPLPSFLIKLNIKN
ncbi:MAG: hypothetical protein EAY75_07880 [Bacteroidetes bacterium]|nr:MAG: hypothetical protein EAY75_07880 [Bacteroidota bacterium]